MTDKKLLEEKWHNHSQTETPLYLGIPSKFGQLRVLGNGYDYSTHVCNLNFTPQRLLFLNNVGNEGISRRLKGINEVGSELVLLNSLGLDVTAVRHIGERIWHH